VSPAAYIAGLSIVGICFIVVISVMIFDRREIAKKADCEKSYNNVNLFENFDKFMSKNTQSIYCVFHSSILFERGWDKTMDYNVNVFSPTNDRMERCKYLTSKTVSSIYNLAKTEIDDLEKNRKSDFVVHNYNEENPALGDILSQVSNIDQKVIDDYLELERKIPQSLTPDGKGIILSHY
jgi:dephospho-CoA kinase